MALKDTWEDLEDKVQGDPDSGSEISVKPINDIAHAVMDLEENEDVVTNTAPYIGDNGNWYEWNDIQQGYVDTGVKATGQKGADGYTPQKGVDYWTDSDKEEIKSYVNEAILGGAW